MVKEFPFKDHEEWLSIRKKYIGGSDAGAIVGLDEYKTPYSLWAEKTGKTEGFGGNISTKVGTYLEELVAKMFTEETGKKVRRKNATLVNDQYPFACANVDRFLVGERSLLECKTSTSLPVMKKIRGGEYPERWYCQMTHYLAVTGLDKAYLAVLINNREFKVYELERDEDEIKALMDAEAEFWTHVKNDTPPSFTGLDPDSEALKVVYSNTIANDEAIQLLGRESDIENLLALKAQKKELDKSIKYYEQVLQGDLKSNEYGVCGNYSVTWKTQTRAAHMVKASTFRKFEVKKLNKEA